ncbi:MAG TPA: hypothetical protein VF789_30745 [Thermoanaerobaculia bacterium]
MQRRLQDHRLSVGKDPPGTVLRRQETAGTDEAAVKRTAPRAIKIAIGPSTAIVFRTPVATVGGISVFATGRMAIQGMASLIGEELPAKGAGAALEARVRALAKTAFDAAAPAGAAAKLELPLGSEKLELELADGAGQLPAFQVSGHFSAQKRDLVLPGCEVANATLTLDATVWIAPTQPLPAGTSPSVPGDASVKRFAFAGGEARFQDAAGKGDRPRTGGVTLKSAMDDFEAKVPDFVKGHKFLQLPEQRAAFFQEMRAYFGSDEKTVEHFAKLEDAKIKGAKTWLHQEAAQRLRAVQAEIGEENMPASGGVGWPRAECSLAGQQTLRNLHNLGFAIDFNAYQAPHLKDPRILDLIQIVTGRSATMSPAKEPGVDPRRVGETFTSGTPKEKEALAVDPKVRKWLEQVASEAEAVGEASEDFRASLKTTGEKGDELDLAPRLQELRQNWHAAKADADRQAILAELPAILKPWLDKVAAEKTAVTTKITAAGLTPDQLPTAKPLDQAAAAAKNLSGRIATLRGKLGATLMKGQRAQVDKLVAEARKLLAEAGEAPANDAAAVAELARLADLVNRRHDALVRKKWLDRVDQLHTALTGKPAFVFGASSQKQVTDPPLAQLVDTGFFTLRGAPKAGKEAFDAQFVKVMSKHGFTHGATWSTPDLMHFELRWKGPGQ